MGVALVVNKAESCSFGRGLGQNEEHPKVLDVVPESVSYKRMTQKGTRKGGGWGVTMCDGENHHPLLVPDRVLRRLNGTRVHAVLESTLYNKMLQHQSTS